MYHYLVFETNNNLLTNNIGSYTVFNIPSYVNEHNWKCYNRLEYYFCKILFDVKNILFLKDIWDDVKIYTTDNINNLMKRDYVVVHYLTEEFEFSFIEHYNKPSKVLNYSQTINYYNSFKNKNHTQYLNNKNNIDIEFNNHLIDYSKEEMYI